MYLENKKQVRAFLNEFFDWLHGGGKDIFPGERWIKPAVLINSFGSCAFNSMSTMLKMYIPRIKYAKPNLHNCSLNFCLSIKGSVWKIFLKSHSIIHLQNDNPNHHWSISISLREGMSGNRSWTLTHGYNMINSDKISSLFFFFSLPFCLNHYVCISLASIVKTWHIFIWKNYII